jgi:hypothetical protein
MVETRTLSFTDCSPDVDGNTFEPTGFVCEENKKSSFVLSNIVVLKVRSVVQAGDSDEASRVISSATISYSAEKENRHELFLFGGFELIANVNTLQVFVTRAESNGEEYLTSCRGVRARDLPPVENQEQMNLLEDFNAIEWFKFVFASPGGAKPVFCVRLEFHVPSTNNDQSASPVVVRSMKTKCRLNGVDTKPAAAAHHVQNTYHLQGTQQLQQPAADKFSNLASIMSMMQNTRAANNSMPTSQYNIDHSTYQGTENMNNLSSMMAMMGNTNSPAAAVQHQTNPALLLNPIPSLHQQQAEQKLEKNHAEMMSSIAGLGMYLKSSEEKTIKSLETMLSQMESRLLQKLDVLSCRLDAIEQQLSCTKLNQMTGVEQMDDNVKRNETIIREVQSSEQSTGSAATD